ncbi:activator of HSP90 ATPase [Flavobacterium supellecticarium]|uniref:Activator of HSP90 ATPase n=1 Tax=Flavobacterium supellecticarium TaxID=2565924 RepID=A0A4S3ZX58_9FLAO|nr:SRPBCC family protein [Flavobacterium supellecticarium]THF50435.1 activator of HSP90 ATPase [Flavobacterium supellecticarium]
MASKITINATILADKNKVWNYYTQPEHITQWNFADPSWHCPKASNDMQIGGTYSARMEAKDGSFGFEFEATYDEISDGEHFSYTMPDGRQVTVTFHENDIATDLVIAFDPENQNPIEMQQNGWQAILNNFKKYAESH